MTMVRGSNPIWFEVDLTAHAFDDTFYLFVLGNDLPYVPLTVWQDPFGNVEWTNPIRFLANGTLPNNIYYDPDTVYRLEFRQGPTQDDPLIYLVENYVPGSSGSTPVDETTFTTDNQITNPQFALINFTSPLGLTSVSTQSISVAPGWFLDLTGSGNVTLTQVLLNSAVVDPTNASYALQIQLNGSWTKAVLRQRFQGNGILWSNTFVSSSITALSGAPPENISAILVDSQGNTLTSILPTTALTQQFNAYPGVGQVLASANTDFPPTAYIDYQLILPTTCNVTLTSIQVVSGDVDIEYLYEQSTIERQIDQTFHYYRDSILRDNKESILTGWDFGLNPWQSQPTAPTNVATFGYTADQTIMIQQAYVNSGAMNNVAVSRAGFALNYGFTVAAVTATNQFAMLQYIPPATVRPCWGKMVSSLVKLVAQKQNSGANCRVKMRLICRAGLPASLSQTEPVASWAALGEPVYSSGWTAIAPLNDPVYNLANGFNELLFEGFVLPASTNDNMTLGILIYTIDPMIQSGTPDNIVFQKASLVQNSFAIDVNSLTYDETLRRCQSHYETSFLPGQVATSTIVNAVYAPMNAYFNVGASTMSCVPNGFGLQYKSVKAIVPNLSFYSGASSTVGNILAFLNASSGNGQNEQPLASFFTTFGGNGTYGFSYRGTGLSTMVSPPSGISSSQAGSAGILYHYVANARLGQ